MRHLALGVVLGGILCFAFVWLFRTQRKQRLVVRVIVPLLIGAASVGSVVWAFSTRDVSIGERLRIVGRDPTLSAIPPGATFRGKGGNECPDAGGPYYAWNYFYVGALDTLFLFYDERLKRNGWKPLTSSTTTFPAPATSTSTTVPRATTSITTTATVVPHRQGPILQVLGAVNYSKSYGSWEAHATLALQPRGNVRWQPPAVRRWPYALTVGVADQQSQDCVE